jgi:RNA polymerase sigma-70 factor (ECF subfamily)
MEPSDGQVVSAVLGGDKEAYGILVDRYVSALVSVAYARTGNRGIAGDLAQDALVEAYQRLADLDDPDRFASWAYAICRNLAMSWVRRRRVERADHARQREAEAERRDRSEDPGQAAARREETERLLVALRSLSDADQEIIALRHLGGTGRQETADLLGVKPEAADKRLQRAMDRLRNAMDVEKNESGGDEP